ncbi:copper ABC transporter ATP-binding protein [Salinarchaeum sp. Harcht-Bsk1]|uniref:ABC transporter ATP-binding protein n=1 Tax=Salinarchaeum sp. Harcht-Bsk1 TaxID=1333523 RepID=UPI0003423609|nr:ABC transporter ATP-binding protein [Salinarchaeum sp. Harcht-Bsk1]AGN02300.1 copper ABC transporter ATP-binding protein [Salinarchaeum sp. Harcht-Bsk1]
MDQRADRASGPETDATTDPIVVDGLTKTYGDVTAVADVSFSVRDGEIFGFLGPNGSGKSTTIKAMLGLLHPDTGTVRLNDHDVATDGKAAKRDVGYLPEALGFYDNLNAVDTLEFFAQLRGVTDPDVHAALAEVGLEHAKHRPVDTYSKGMRQLLGIAQATIGSPSTYVLDEPASGLDPRWVRNVREKIFALRDAGATIFLSSHILSEIQRLCDRVAIIDDGRLLVVDTVAAVGNHLEITPQLELTVPGLDGEMPQVLYKLDGVETARADGDTLLVTSTPGTRATVVARLVQAGYTVADFRTLEPSLEEAFVQLIAEGDDDGWTGGPNRGGIGTGSADQGQPSPTTTQHDDYGRREADRE